MTPTLAGTQHINCLPLTYLRYGALIGGSALEHTSKHNTKSHSHWVRKACMLGAAAAAPRAAWLQLDRAAPSD
jgi:hypothetical protein